MDRAVPHLSLVIAFASFLLPGEESQAQSVRRDITTLSATELRDYRDAFRQLQQNGEYARLAGYHGCPGHYCHNDSRIFLPWHRAYCLEFEKALQQVDSSLALHYWDWTSNNAIQNGIPRAFIDVQYQSGGTTYPNPLRRFRYRCGGRDQFTARFPGSSFLLGNLRNQVNNSYGSTSYNTFNGIHNSPSGPHGGLHTWVGGDMGNLEWAAYDPIFWAHHSNVDRQWARWRDSGNGRDPSATIQALALRPFRKSGTDVTVRDMLDYHTLGYTYDRLTSLTFEGYQLSASGSVTIKDFRLPASGTPIWLTVHDLPAHPSKSFRVYVFINQTNATVDDVRPNNPRFAGFFGIFGGRQGPLPKEVEHIDEPPQTERVVDLAPALGRVLDRGAVTATFSVTLVATDTDGEVVDLSELPFDRISVQAGEKEVGKPEKQGQEKPVPAHRNGGTTSPKPSALAGAPSILTDASGKQRKLEDFQGNPTVLVLFLGFGCEPCVKRLQALAGALPKTKAQVVCVSADPSLSSEHGRGLPFVFLSDPCHSTFRRFGCYDKRPLHGALVLDERGSVVWSEVGGELLADLDGLLSALTELTSHARKEG